MRTRIESSPPGWVWALLPLGLLIFFVLRAALRKSVTVPNWGFCRTCLVSLMTRLFTGLALLACGVVCLGVVVAVADETSRLGWLALAGVSLLIAGYVGIRISARDVIARARLTQDGRHVEVRSPAPVFAAQVEAALAAAQVQPVPW
jgi:hypothetical protein